LERSKVLETLNPESGERTHPSRRETDMRALSRTLLRRVNAYTLWAFNPQRELTSRYDRAA
jgi:hypothetical protein